MAYRGAHPVRRAVRVAAPRMRLVQLTLVHAGLVLALLGMTFHVLTSGTVTGSSVAMTLLIAMCLALAAPFHTLDVRARQRSRHRWLRSAELTVLGEGDARRILVDGREHDAAHARCALTHHAVSVGRTAASTTHFYGVHIVFAEMAYQVLHTKQAAEAEEVARSIATELSLGRVRELEFAPHGARSATFGVMGVVLIQTIAAIGVIVGLSRGAPIGYGGGVCALVLLHVVLHELLLRTGASSAEAAAVELIDRSRAGE